MVSSGPGMESAGLPTQVNEGALQSPLDDLRAESEVIRRQVGALREVVSRLRDAAQKMEGERAELRTFLDGSDSALARLEAWVGKQMGLNLEQSADSARRYLPLSVVWVIAMRLKNLVALLYDSSRTLTVSQEQMDETLGELQSAVEAASRFSGAMTQVAGGPQNGFSATVAQFAWQPAPANSAEALSPGARAELERSVREELRRSLEDSVRDEIAALVRREEEQRLRHEIEIQVRRQFLSEMGPGGASGPISQTLPTVHTPREQGPAAGAGEQRAILGGARGLPRRGAGASFHHHGWYSHPGAFAWRRRGDQRDSPRDAHAQGRGWHDGIHRDPDHLARL